MSAGVLGMLFSLALPAGEPIPFAGVSVVAGFTFKRGVVEVELAGLLLGAAGVVVLTTAPGVPFVASGFGLADDFSSRALPPRLVAEVPAVIADPAAALG